MAKKSPTALYFTTVAVLEKNLAVLGGHLYLEEAHPTVTRPLVCNNGNWGHLEDFDEIVYAATKKPVPTPRATFCMLGRGGHYREIVSGRPPADAALATRDAGYLMDLRYIGEHLYACGVQNIVYRQAGAQWTRMDVGTFAPIADRVDRSFESIDGFSEDDIYAVGMAGAIWHWDGKNWTRLESPTNFPLYCVLCASNGDAYIGGSNGLLFKGRRGSGWTDLSDASVTSEVFEDMTEFQGKIYITATEALIETDGGPIVEVDVPVDGQKSFYAIDSNAQALWSVGDDCVLQFDGKLWQRHTCPDNV